MELAVGTIAGPNGLRGEVGVVVRTDDPRARFVAGAAFVARAPKGSSAELTELTVARSRWQGEKLMVAFVGHETREAAEALRGIELLVEADASDETDAWYPHELVGLRAVTMTGESLGTVVGLTHLPAHDLLEVKEPSGIKTLVPFVKQIVPTVDVAKGMIVVTPPGGLFGGGLEDSGMPDDAASEA